MCCLAQWVALSSSSIYVIFMITNNFWLLRTSTCCGLPCSNSMFPSITLSWFQDFQTPFNFTSYWPCWIFLFPTMFLTEALTVLAPVFGWAMSCVPGHFISRLPLSLCPLLVQSSGTTGRKKTYLEGSMDMACWVGGSWRCAVYPAEPNSVQISVPFRSIHNLICPVLRGHTDEEYIVLVRSLHWGMVWGEEN